MMDDEPGPLGKATKICCLKGTGEETLCLERFQLQPGQPPTLSAPVQHQKPKLEQHSLSARLDGDSSDLHHTAPQVSRSLPTPDSARSLGGSVGSTGSVCSIPPCQCCPHVPTSTAFCSCRMFQEPPALVNRAEAVTSARSSESLLSLQRRLLCI